VLIVEDDPDLRAALRRGLEEGFRADAAATAGELLERVARGAADALAGRHRVRLSIERADAEVEAVAGDGGGRFVVRLPAG
jgi:CheY-like chemotaxis protein